MGSDFLALSALADELNSALSGARIDKIVQPEADEIRLFLRAGGRNECLVASCNAGAPRLHLTSERKSNPVTAPGFCMLLRKYLSVSVLEEIGMWRGDRIVFLRFDARTEMRDHATFYLFIEIMNRYSNIVFTDADLVILDAVKHLGFDDGGGHVVLRGVRYAPPEQPKPNFLTAEARERTDAFQGGDLHRHILNSVSGLSGATVSELLLRAGIDADLPRPMNEEEKERLHALFDALADVTHAPFYSPCIIGREVYPFPYAAAKGGKKGSRRHSFRLRRVVHGCGQGAAQQGKAKSLDHCGETPALPHGKEHRHRPRKARRVRKHGQIPHHGRAGRRQYLPHKKG